MRKTAFATQESTGTRPRKALYKRMHSTFRKRVCFVLTALILCLGLPRHAEAQCPDTPQQGIVANPNRPTVANPADITQYGVLEVEYGYNHVQGLTGERDNNLIGLFKFAATCNFEIRWDTDTLLHQAIGGSTKNGFCDQSLWFQERFGPPEEIVSAVAVIYFPTISNPHL